MAIPRFTSTARPTTDLSTPAITLTANPPKIPRDSTITRFLRHDKVAGVILAAIFLSVLVLYMSLYLLKRLRIWLADNSLSIDVSRQVERLEANRRWFEANRAGTWNPEHDRNNVGAPGTRSSLGSDGEVHWDDTYLVASWSRSRPSRSSESEGIPDDVEMMLLPADASLDREDKLYSSDGTTTHAETSLQRNLEGSLCVA